MSGHQLAPQRLWVRMMHLFLVASALVCIASVSAPSASASIPTPGIDTSITSAPSGTTSDATPTFTFSSNLSFSLFVSFRCNVDGAAWFACESPHTASSLGQGPHTFQVRTVLLGLFTDATPASASFVVDTLGPTIAISSPIDGSTTGASSVQVVYDATDNGGAAPTCSPASGTEVSLEYGENTISVSCTDAANNTAIESVSVTRIDDQAPVVDITAPVADEDGDFDFTPAFTPVSVGGSGGSSCAIDASGAAKCWGWNERGQLGDGTTENRSRPVSVVGLGGPVTQIDGDQAHTCALLQSGGVKCWGWNTFGQLGDGTTTDRSAPTDVVGMSSGVADISGGGSFNCGLSEGGGVKCWGRQTSGQLGNGISNLSSSTATDVIGLTSGVEQIDSGDGHSCALLTNGEVKCWGSNSYGQLGDGTQTSRSTPVTVVGIGGAVRSVVTGNWRTCVLLESGGVECWGWNPWGQLGDGTTSDHRSTPGPVSGITDAVELSAGFQLTCARRSTGQLTCWGGGGYGERGDGSSSTALTPTDVIGMSSTSSFFARGNHACAINGAGELKCWGYNNYGQVGDGTTVNRNTPTTVLGMSQNGTLPPVEFSVSEAGATVTCMVDGAAPVACSSPFALGSLAAGMHTVTVNAADAAGNVGSDSLAIEIHAPPPDPTAPQTTMTGPSGYTNDTTPTYLLSADKPGSTFQCSVNNGSYMATGASFTAGPLSTTGSHTIRCRATADGLTDPTPASATVTIDTLAPTVSATCVLTAESAASCTFTATDPGTTIPSPPGTCVTIYPSPCCPPGMVCIATPTCVPLAGQPGYYQCTYPAPPTVIPGSGIDRVECAVDSGTPVVCTSPFVSAPLGPGTHTVTITAFDRAGNATATVRSVTV